MQKSLAGQKGGPSRETDGPRMLSHTELSEALEEAGERWGSLLTLERTVKTIDPHCFIT